MMRSKWRSGEPTPPVSDGWEYVGLLIAGRSWAKDRSLPLSSPASYISMIKIENLEKKLENHFYK